MKAALHQLKIHTPFLLEKRVERKTRRNKLPSAGSLCSEFKTVLKTEIIVLETEIIV
ncbi:hypothetical protein Nmel_003256 [Mimus melanotis]